MGITLDPERPKFVFTPASAKKRGWSEEKIEKIFGSDGEDQKGWSLSQASLNRLLRGVEGVVVKRPDGAYPLDGQPGDPPSTAKWHKAFSAVVVVLDKTQTKTSGVYIYHYGVPI